MALTLAQLTNPKTAAQMRQQLYDGLQGRGVVTKTGTGTGALTVSGAPLAGYAAQVKISSSGEPGAAQFQYSLDGGVTWSTAATIPSSGAYGLGTTGASVTFAAGPSGAGTSFVAGDLFTFSLTFPTCPVTSWQDGSTPRVIVDVDAQELADLTSIVAAIARGGFVTTQPGVTGASGSWLDLLGQNFYGVSRNLALATVGTVTLTDAQSAGPFTIAPGQIWLGSTTSLSTSTPLRFLNTTGGTLPKGGALTLTVAAEMPGSAYNVANGAITTLLTTLPGVTANNPDPGSGSWVTSQGTDQESDLAYSTRLQGKWPSIGIGATATTYDYWARTASSEVTRTKVAVDTALAVPVNAAFTAGAGTLATGTYYYRVVATKGQGATLPSTETSFALTGPGGVNVNWGQVAGADGYQVFGRTTGAEQLLATIVGGSITTWLDNGSVTPSGAMPTVATNPVGGQVNIWLAGSSGAVSAAAVTAVQTYLAARLPLGSVQATANTTGTAITIAGTVYVAAASLATAQAAVATAMQALIANTPIGGTLYLSQVIEQLNLPSGVRNTANVTVNGAAADLALSSSSVATGPTLSLTWVTF